MAEMVMKDLVKKAGLENQFYIDSAATSTEEIGNGMHYGTVSKLREMGIPFTNHRARQITLSDYNDYDYLIGMDSENLYNMHRKWNNDPQNKVHLLLDFCKLNRDVADPWYTGDFDATYTDVVKGCTALLELLGNSNGKG